MLPEILAKPIDELKGNLESSNIQIREPVSVVKIAGVEGVDRKVNFLIFENKSTFPIILMKQIRSGVNQESLINEYESLKIVSSLPNLRGKVPNPIGLLQHDGVYTLIESCVPGMTLENHLLNYSHINQWQVSRDLGAISNWLIHFQKTTSVETTVFRGSIEIKERIDSGAFQLPGSFLDSLLNLAKDAEGMRIPLCAQHGDFWPGNIIPTADGIYVIDWEGFSPCALPFMDPFMFAVSYAWSYCWKGLTCLKPTEAFARTFLEKNWLSSKVNSFIYDVVNTLSGIDRIYMRLFFSLFMMDMANPNPDEKRIHVGNKDLWMEHLNLFAQMHGEICM